MRETLADNLNLTGMARHNLAIRHKMRLSQLTDENSMSKRLKIPAAWEPIVSLWNHTELAHINQIARTAGCKPPFDFVERLVEDTREIFFSECLHWLKTARPKVDANDICLCSKCSSNNAAQESRQQPVPTTNHTDNVLNVPAILQQVPLWQQQIQPQQLIMPIYWFPPPPLYSIPTFCCKIYKQHCLQSNKRGQPPHDQCCAHRKKANRPVA